MTNQDSKPGEEPHLSQSLGLFSATALVIGSMIGSGIYIVDADIARLVNSPALYLAAWVVTGVMTVIAALSYAELAAMMPRAGGQYVYIRESMGPLGGFLFGWTLFLVIQTGTIAAVCVAFGKFLGVFFPSVSATNWIWHIAHVPPLRVGDMVLGNMDIGLNTANLAGIMVIVFLTVVNTFGVQLGALIQNIFTSAKAFALAVLVLLAFTIGFNSTALQANFGPHFSNFWQNAGWSSLHQVQVGVGGPITWVNLLVILAVVQVGSLFAADAWNNVTYTAGEVKNPKRNLPLSLILGTGFVVTVYFVVSLAYLMVLPLHGDPNGATALARGVQYAADDRVATAVLGQILHSAGAYLMAGAILISTFGCVNGLTLAGARVYYAMSNDGLFFKSVGKLHPQYKTPVAGLLIQGAWAIVLCVSGSYGQLLDYIIFAELVFYAVTIAGLFVLRAKQPNAPRPYKAWGYPVLPAIYIVMAVWICIVLLRYKPQYTWPGLILVLLGIPVYLFWSRRASRIVSDRPKKNRAFLYGCLAATLIVLTAGVLEPVAVFQCGIMQGCPGTSGRSWLAYALEPMFGYDGGIGAAHVLDITPFTAVVLLLVISSIVASRGKKGEEVEGALEALNRCDGCGTSFRNFTALAKVEGKGFLCEKCRSAATDVR